MLHSCYIWVLHIGVTLGVMVITLWLQAHEGVTLCLHNINGGVRRHEESDKRPSNICSAKTCRWMLFSWRTALPKLSQLRICPFTPRRLTPPLQNVTILKLYQILPADCSDAQGIFFHKNFVEVCKSGPGRNGSIKRVLPLTRGPNVYVD